MAPFVAAAGGIVGPGMVPVAIAMGVVIYALLPPAAIIGGLQNIWDALLPRATAATKAKTVATSAKSTDAPTGHSARDVAGPRRSSLTGARTRATPTAAGVPPSHSGSPAAGTSPKKSTSGGEAKRSVGGSGRNR
jgi:hypothetical protein